VKAELVEIRHPDHPGVTSRVSRRAFEQRSSKLGWILASNTPEAAAVVDPPLDEKAALTAKLEAAGIPVDGRWGMKRLRAEVAKLGTDEDFD
jgi:hypothetical protein